MLCASNGRQALQIFLESAPPLIIVDSALPEFGGLELCRRLRQTSAGRQAYVIMLTPPDDEETLVRLFEAGVDDFVTKPFAARPLFARIRASLRVVSLQHKVTADRDEIHRVHAELAVAHRRLEQDALTDVLTGLTQPPLPDRSAGTRLGRRTARWNSAGLHGGRYRSLQDGERHLRP